MPESLFYDARLIDVIDGDTIDVEVRLGFDITITSRLRLYNVDTPEIHNTKHTSQEYLEGITEKIFVASWFEDVPEWFQIEVRGKGYFGRWVAIVRPAPGETSLNEILISRGWYREGWVRNGRPYWNPVGGKIDIKYPRGKQSLIGPGTRTRKGKT